MHEVIETSIKFMLQSKLTLTSLQHIFLPNFQVPCNPYVFLFLENIK